MSDLLNIDYDIVEETINILNIHVSMDAPFNEDGENNLFHILSDENSLNPEAGLIMNSLQMEVERTLARLTEREAEVLRYNFGIKGNMAQSLAEIGLKLGLTRERVRQIKIAALKKLRSRKHSKHTLREYISN